MMFERHAAESCKDLPRAETHPDMSENTHDTD